LPAIVRPRYDPAMFLVSEKDAAELRAIYDRDGEFSAAIELRRRVRGIGDNEHARACVRAIVDWAPLPERPSTVMQFRRDR
jgi:hypothetical protein